MNMFWVPSDTIMTLPGESQTHKPFKNRNFQVSTHVQVVQVVPWILLHKSGIHA